METNHNEMNRNTKADYYVAPNGCDTWSGRLAMPSRDGADGPLATLNAARRAVRTMRASGATHDVRVLIREGLYQLQETVVFGLADAAPEEVTTTYEAYPGEMPVFSSGVPIGNWRKLETYPDALPVKAHGNVWVADLPDPLERFQVLFDGERRLERAHGPTFKPTRDAECEHVPSQNVAREEDRHWLRYVPFPPGALKKWTNLADVELRFTPVPWTLNLLPLRAVDEERCVAELAVEATAPLSIKLCKWGMRAENVIDFLDRPGRWVLNTQTRQVYLWPEGGAPGENIVAPCLQELVRIEGDIDYDGPVDQPVRNIVLRGLTFTHGDRDRTDPDYKGWGIQHDWEMFDKGTALVRLRGAESCCIDACRFTNTGGTALRLDLYCQRVAVTRSLFDYIGHMGILLCGYGPGTKDVNHHNVIENNLIHHCGEVVWHGHAVFAWQSGSNRIAHNCIHHCARKAVGICGVRIPIFQNRSHTFDEAARTIRWHEIDATIASEGDDFDRYLPYLHARDNVVEANEVYRVLEKINDGAALNVSGAGEGNVICGNYIHHIATNRCSSVLRVDDWQRGTVFRDNVIYMCNVGGITRKNFNHIENNILADVSTVGYVRFASYPDEVQAYGSRIQRNIFYESGDGAAFYVEAYLVSPGASYPKDCDADRNVFYCVGNPKNSAALLEHWRKRGIETHSISADPMFVDPVNGDFRLLPDSPVTKVGFREIDMDRIGLNGQFPSHWRELDDGTVDLVSEYDRGKDPAKKHYEWW